MISFWSEESWCEDALGSPPSGYDAGIVSESGPREETRRTSRDRRGEGRSAPAEERVAARANGTESQLCADTTEVTVCSRVSVNEPETVTSRSAR